LSLTQRDRVRRTAILCSHCLRNIAFYRAGWRHGRFRVQREFWRNTNSGCVDVAVLEWCKLFTEARGKHHWTKSVPDAEGFRQGLYARLGVSDAEFTLYGKTIKHYRDKFVAHLDEEPTMFIPRLRQARRSVAYLYDFLRNEPTTAAFLPDASGSATARYTSWYLHALREYLEGSKA
jgi:hypothetical protein